jgi:tetraacyldisaccharide 4'-kinase
MKIQHIIENQWYKKNSTRLSILLYPLSLVFGVISKLRYYLYKSKFLKSYKLPVPVIIIGNITVGGSGKTPLTKFIASELAKSNIKVGVILRGYKSTLTNATIVEKHNDPQDVGDEALIYANSNIPVAIGKNRYHAGLKLLEHYPNTQVILSDDGMQHYRLQRDYEIAVIDASRWLGNKCLLPNGPLRESINRLKKVNSIVINSQTELSIQETLKNLHLDKTNITNPLVINQKLVLQKIYNPITQETLNIQNIKTKKIVAIAAIGNPNRFFDFIENLGIKLVDKISYPDHYFYQECDIPDNCDIILTSDKDYTKLAKFNNKRIWVVEVSSSLNKDSIITDIHKLIKA